MGAASNPISAITQTLEKGVSVTTAASSTKTGATTVGATFTFPTPPAGSTWTGTLVCANAPVGAIFTATIGATSWGQWSGTAVFGPIQIQGQGSQQLVITATGLAFSTSYEMWLLGSSDQTNNVAPIWPETTSINGSVTANFAPINFLSDQIVTLTTSYVAIYNEIQTAPVNSVGVVVNNATSAVSVQVINQTTGQNLTTITNTSGIIAPGETGSNDTFYFPISAAQGQRLTVYVKAAVGQAGIEVRVMALSQYPSVMVQTANSTSLSVRDSGGLSSVSQGVMAASVVYTMLAAAPNGYCYRLWRYGAVPQFGTPAGAYALTETTTGAYIATFDSPQSGLVGTVNAGSIALDGQLTKGPVGTSFAGGVAAGSYLRYDIIPLPSFATT